MGNNRNNRKGEERKKESQESSLWIINGGDAEGLRNLKMRVCAYQRECLSPNLRMEFTVHDSYTYRPEPSYR